jgi:hypothetical protein
MNVRRIVIYVVHYIWVPKVQYFFLQPESLQSKTLKPIYRAI